MDNINQEAFGYVRRKRSDLSVPLFGKLNHQVHGYFQYRGILWYRKTAPLYTLRSRRLCDPWWFQAHSTAWQTTV